ncbi:MAG: zinc ABC transporter substrate-binding protein, partial [Lachnospiraceae bacterium]|nr:zinc ABC transporter substrate-binding protein [Lachnospiraceae bacterium]
MKKFIYMFGTFVLGAALYSGCGFQTTPIEKGADKVSVVCTTFPQYDWVMNLLGDAAEEFEVSLLVKNSADIHNYQPSAQDMIAMKEADLFLYVGGESDAWVEDIMKADGTLSDKSVSLVAAIGDKSLVEEIVEGMEHDHEHGHGHEKDHEHADEVLDEHVWLSLENAEILCQYISGRLQELAPDEAVVIAENTATYVKELHELGVEYQEVVDESAHNALIFGDRFPFRYLTEDYDLEYYAAFAGCNAEVEAGFDTIIGLAGKVDELKVPCVLVIDGSDKSLAEAILQAAGDKDKEILTLDSMQSVSWEDILRGANYLDIM